MSGGTPCVKRHGALACILLGCASAAVAGPPYLTDDPEPTDAGHWEIYAFSAAEGRRSTIDADAGFDLNYGAAKGVQLTATVPLNFSHAPRDGWKGGAGDLELGIKYRFFNDEAHGVSAAIFPRAILPTASHSPGEKLRFLLPLWVQKDFGGGTSLFGGGGYTINPGAGNSRLLASRRRSDSRYQQDTVGRRGSDAPGIRHNRRHRPNSRGRGCDRPAY